MGNPSTLFTLKRVQVLEGEAGAIPGKGSALVVTNTRSRGSGGILEERAQHDSLGRG